MNDQKETVEIPPDILPMVESDEERKKVMAAAKPLNADFLNKPQPQNIIYAKLNSVVSATAKPEIQNPPRYTVDPYREPLM